MDRPSYWLQWARETFGEIALQPRERALRFIEEVIELAQAMNIEPEIVSAIIRRVYSRPSGAVPREMGQCLTTFEMLALAIGVDADAEATAELDRVKSIPKNEWAIRHNAKVALGIASPTAKEPTP